MSPKTPRLTELTFRAWHHFREATPLIVPLLQAFRREKFSLKALRTRLRAIAPDGSVYLIRRAPGKTIEIRKIGGKKITQLDAPKLAELIDRRHYREAELAIRRAARSARLDAGF